MNESEINKPGQVMPQQDPASEAPSQPLPSMDEGGPASLPPGLSSINPQFYSGVLGFFGGISKIFKSAKGMVSGIGSKPQSTETAATEAPGVAATVEVQENPKHGGVAKKIGTVIVAVAVILGIIYAGSGLISSVREKGGIIGFGKNGDDEVTPTIVKIEPSEPSVYAKDEVILQLENDINTLDSEMTNTVLRENSLNPPSLDFDINFNK